MKKQRRCPHACVGRHFFVVLTALLTMSMTACFEQETVSISYLGVNHTDKSVTGISINGGGGILNVSAQGGGGKTACCVTLPKKWRPGLMVTIKWQGPGSWLKDEKGQEVLRQGQTVLVEDPWKTQTVEVPAYTPHDLEHFDIHFFPNDQVQVKASYIYPEHPDYRPAYPQKKSTKP